MAMTKNQKTALGVGVAAVGLLLLTGAMKKEKSHKTIIRPGETTSRYMGQMFTLRLPRGEYEMIGGDGLTVITDVDTGTTTDVVLVSETRATGFTTEAIFANVDDPTEQYTITVRVMAIPAE